MAQVAEAPINQTRRRTLWIEFVIVILYLIVPSIFALLLPPSDKGGTAYFVYSLVYIAGRIGIVLFVIWASDGSLKTTGITRPAWRVDILFGLCLIVVYLLGFYVDHYFHLGGFDLAAIAADNRRLLQVGGASSLAMAAIYAFVASVEREIAARSFATNRLLELTNPVIACIVPAVLFSLANGRIGFAFWFTQVLASAMFGFAFVKTRRIWAGLLANLAAHFLLAAIAIAYMNGTLPGWLSR